MYDPIAIAKARDIFPDIYYGDSAYDAAAGADAIIIVTEWNEFKQLNLERLKGLMRTPIVYDGRNVYDPIRDASNGILIHRYRPATRRCHCKRISIEVYNVWRRRCARLSTPAC